MRSPSACKTILLGLLGACVFAGATAADGMARRSLKDTPAKEEARRCTWSVNLGATSDYVFRGISQSAEDPALQGGGDLTCGIWYAGVWASTIRFGEDIGGRGIATAEVDWYAGAKPVWGPLTFDLGMIYYSYPGALDDNILGRPRELDYVELKAGVSGSPVDKVTLGLTLFWTPEGTNETGSVFTLEGTAGYELPKISGITPTINGTLGWQTGDDARYALIVANGDDNYLYWNVGLSLAVDKLTLDFRYWDTNISNAGNFCTGPIFQCDARFVFSAKVTVP